ncbi:MAG: hypothetical protein WC343_07235 [Bacilli bacterium]|jgi:hypothetical protein
MAISTPYCEIDGLVCTDVVTSIEPRPGMRSVGKTKLPGKRYGRIVDQGQDPKSYLVKARFWDESDMDDWLEAVNDIQPGAEAFLFRNDRCVLVEFAEAHKVEGQVALDPLTSAPMNFYRAEATLHCLDSYEYGTDKGIAYATAQTLPQTTALISNAGKIPAGLDYLHVSGDYDVGGGYTDDLTLSVLAADGTTVLDQVELCDILMRGDHWRLGRWGRIEHYYQSDLAQAWADIKIDLHGIASGGSISSGILTLDDGDHFYIPFYGSGYPLPATEDCYLELWVSALANDVSVVAAFETDRSDWADVDYDLHVGYNKIYIPGCEGQDFVAMGVLAASGATNSISLTGFRGTVHRYIPYSRLLKVEPGEAFYLKLDDAAGSNGLLSAVEVAYRDIFWG